MDLCHFGCGQTALYHFNTGRSCCSSHVNKCPARKAEVSSKHKGKIPWSKGQTKETNTILAAQSAKAKGRIKSKEHLDKIRATKIKNGKAPWNKGLRGSTDPRILKGEKNGMWGRTHTPEVIQLLSDLAKNGHFAGETNPWYGKPRSGPLSPRYRHDIDHKEFNQFKHRVYNLTEKVYREYKDEINPCDHPRTKAGIPNGYHLDHKVSISYGYANGWSPEQLAAKENLQMLPWLDNIRKHSKCDWD